VAVQDLGGEADRDLRTYFSHLGIPVDGESELRMIPAPVAAAMAGLCRAHRRLRPGQPYDIPFLPFSLRAGLKFLSEYDTDFSRATADGDLSAGFSPDDALSRVQCPMLLLRASASRHPDWGLLGAMDDQDVRRVQALVDHLRVETIPCRHEIHLLKPDEYVRAVTAFVDELEATGRL
jgi:hypothetical protein